MIKPAIYLISFVSLFKKTLMLISSPFSRFFLSLAELPFIKNIFTKPKVSVIVSENDTYDRIKKLTEKSGIKSKIKGRVSILQEDAGEEIIGTISQLNEIIKENRLTEIIFSLKDIFTSQIIELISRIAKSGIKIELVPEGENFILSSKNVLLLKEPDTG